MTAISREEAERVVENLFIPGFVFKVVEEAFPTKFAFWLGRTLFFIPAQIKKWKLRASHPVATAAGGAVVLSKLAESNAAILVACRVVAVIRPLLEATDHFARIMTCSRVLTRKHGENRYLAEGFCKMRGSRPSFPGPFSQFGKLLSNSYGLAINTTELIDAMTAPKEDLLLGSFTELHEIVTQMEKGKLGRALDVLEPWLDDLIKHFDMKINLEQLKDIIKRVGKYDISNLTEATLAAAVQIVTKGIFDMR